MRPTNQLRPISVTRNFTTAPGSVLWKQGETLVLATAAVEQKRPRFFTDSQPGGWVTGEYVMHPASVNDGRKDWPGERVDKRATEIGRLIGRSLRAAVDMTKIGPHTITVDCTVLQADGGTRTASICAGMIALRDALAKLPDRMPGTPYSSRRSGFSSDDIHGSDSIPAALDPKYYKPAEGIVAPLAAVSVGIIDGQAYLDLDYALDSRAEVDLNVVRTAAGNYVELQGSAEAGTGWSPAQQEQMLALANAGIDELIKIQNSA